MSFGILPYGDIEGSICHFITMQLHTFTGHPVKLLPAKELCAAAFDGLRQQYNASIILEVIHESAPLDISRILGVVDVDIFLPVLQYIFGQAQLNGKAAVISLYRLRPEYYGFHYDETVFQQRVFKEVVHELGHTLGLVHCPDKQCIMSVSYNVINIDRKSATLCQGCEPLFSAALEQIEGG